MAPLDSSGFVHSHEGAHTMGLSLPGVPLGFHKELSSCVRGSWDEGWGRAWQATLVDEGGIPTAHKSPCSLRKATLGIQMPARITQPSPCWKMQTHLEERLSKQKPHREVKDTGSALERWWCRVGPFQLGAISLLCPVSVVFQVLRIYRSLYHLAFLPQIVTHTPEPSHRTSK